MERSGIPTFHLDRLRTNETRIAGAGFLVKTRAVLAKPNNVVEIAAN
jgi:hypothetical protein